MSDATSPKPIAVDTGLTYAPPSLPGLAMVLAVLVATIALAHLLREWLPEQSLMLLFLLAVLLVSISRGFWTGLLTSLAAFLTFNFFFVEPLLTFRVSRPEDALSLAVLLVAGAATGFLAGRMRDEAATARARETVLARLAHFSEALNQLRLISEVKQSVLDHLTAVEGAHAVILEPREGKLEVCLLTPPGQVLSPEEEEAAVRTFRRGSGQSRALREMGGSRYDFVNLGAGLGVVGYRPGPSERRLGELTDQLCRTIVQQGALAIERIKLAEAAREAEARATQERLRSTLLSSLSHDLRTPLATILGGTTSLRELGEALTPAGRLELLEAIEQETRRLSSYVGNLLDLTRLRSGLDIRRISVDVQEVAHGAANRVRQAYPGRTINLHTSGPEAIVRADAALLEQALFNLLDNALKFSPPETAVDLDVACQPLTVVVSVIDSGSGIAPGDLDRIFEPFFRSKEAGTGGTGLGLTIARSIAELHGGTLKAESPRPTGAGTIMRLALPRAEVGDR
jgi:two-component system sensor histidine kinase KdpD